MLLDFSETKLTHPQLKIISDRLHHASKLDLSYTRFGCPLVRVKQEPSACKFFTVQYIDRKSDGFAYLCDVLSKNETIKELCLAGNDITSHQIIDYLCPALSVNSSIKKIDLSDNLIGKDSLDEIINVVKNNNSTIEVIQIYPCVCIREAKKSQKRLDRILQRRLDKYNEWFQLAPILANEKYCKDHLFKYSFRDISSIIQSFK